MKIKEKKRRPDPIIKDIFQPVTMPSIGSAYKEIFQPMALPAIGSTIAKLNAEFSKSSQLMQPETESIDAICENFERLLSDERLLKHPHNHAVIKKFYDKLTDQYIGEIEKALDTISSYGGKASAAPFKKQERVIQDYYRNHRGSYKNKDDAAFDIAHKEEIDGVKITVKFRKIREYLVNI